MPPHGWTTRAVAEDALEYFFIFFSPSTVDGHNGTIDTEAPRLRREGSEL